MKASKLLSRRIGLVYQIDTVAQAIATTAQENELMPWDIPPVEEIDCRAIEREIKKLKEILFTMKQAQKKLNKLLED